MTSGKNKANSFTNICRCSFIKEKKTWNMNQNSWGTSEKISWNVRLGIRVVTEFRESILDLKLKVLNNIAAMEISKGRTVELKILRKNEQC